MRAHLVLKQAGDSGNSESVIPTAATIKKFLASPETVQKAENAAKKLGFKVVNVTPLQVTIEGPKEQFEKAFSSRLKPVGSTSKSNSASRGSTKKAAKKKPVSREAPVSAQLWTWENTPELPIELEGAVREIVLPRAIALH